MNEAPSIHIPERTFGLKIDFEKGSESPERVFTAMTELITATRNTDRTLIQGVSGDIKTILLLEDIEIGSVTAILRTILKATDDNALKDGDWKKILGNYLLCAKYAILRNFPEKNEGITKQSIGAIQETIIHAAEQTGAAALPFYHPPSIPEIIDSISNYQQAVQHLGERETASILDQNGERISIPKIADYSRETAIAALREKEFSNELQAMLGVKKPDYLGRSRWSFVYDGKTIEAPILHETWLARFQNREIDVRPGDALRVIIRVTVTYGSGSNVLNTRHEVLEVIEVDRSQPEPRLINVTPKPARKSS